VLSVLGDLDDERLDALVEDLTFDTAAHWNEVEVDEAVEQAFYARPAPALLFDTVVTDEASLTHALRQAPPRWRLDVLLAVEDLATRP
jgi:hypothetical protein